MTDAHRRVAGVVAAELAARPDVTAVLITGSLARGEAVASSDVDLAVVLTDDSSSTQVAHRVLRDGLLVEWGERSEAAWAATFDRPRTSWLYTFLDGVVAHDPSGAAARLAELGRSTLSSHTTSPELRAELATALWHGQAKLDRAQASDDAAIHGFQASLALPSILDGLYAIHDAPLPAGSRRLDLLWHASLTRWELERLAVLLVGLPRERIDAAADLATHLRTALGPPDLERT